MQITCTNCSARYRVPDKSIGPAGRRVRCAKCDHVWHVELETASEEQLPESPVVANEDALESEGSRAAVSDSLTENDMEAPPVDQELAEKPQKSGDAVSENQEEAQSEPEAEEAEAEAAGKVDQEQEEVAKRRRKMREERKQSQSESHAKSKPGTSIGWAALVVFVFGLGGSLYFFRQEIAQTWPPVTILYQMIGLDYGLENDGLLLETNSAIDYESVIKISNAAETRPGADGTVNLVVTGEVKNISDQVIPAPRLTGLLRNAAGDEIFRWSFGMQITSIPPFALVSFETLAENISLDTVTVEVIPEWPETE